MASQLRIHIPGSLSYESVSLSKNYTYLLSELQRARVAGKQSTGLDDEEYRSLINDIWIGIILTLMIISVVICLCSCFMYHKFQQWKRHCEC